jgi:hypothetical protein
VVCAALATDIEVVSATTDVAAGAGSSAAIAAATLASARGDAPIDGAAILGGLLPDGSIAGAPTPGDVEAARAAGIKRLGIPAGTRSAYDPGRKKRVDLVEAGAAAGIEIIELADLADAYALLTGADLPRPEPAASEDMELEGAIERRLEASYQGWRQRLAPQWSRVLERGEARLGDRARRLVARLHRGVAAAEQERASGQVASALYRLRRAYALSREAMRLGSRGPDMPEAERRVELEALVAAIEAAIEAIRSDGFGDVGEVIGRSIRAADLAAARALVAIDAVDSADYFRREAAARALLATASGAVEIEGSWGTKAAIPAARAGLLAAAHHRAAAALGDTARFDLDGSRDGDVLAELAAARRAHLEAWTGLARRELLGLERHPKSGAITAARNPKALERLLELADDAARRRARAAQVAAGAIPVTARLLYQAARSLRDGTVTEKLEALELYWRSGWLSELAVTVSRK